MSLSISNKNVYTKLKIFHYPEKLRSFADGTITPPLHVRIKPTNKCNHRCWYCSYRISGVQIGKDMQEIDFIPAEKMMEIAEDLVEMGVKAVTFSGGGEPLYYPYLLRAMRILHKGNVKIAVLTNGSLLKGEVGEWLANHASWVRVSIDGWDEESYAFCRNVAPKEFHRVIANMKNFIGTCYLGANIVVTQNNAGHIRELVQLMDEAGASSIKVTPVIVSNDAQQNNCYHGKIYEQVREQIEKVKDIVFDDYHLQSAFGVDYDWCPTAQIRPVIGADCNVYFCHDKAYNKDEGLMGSIQHQGFKDFWMSNREKFLKINPKVSCTHHCIDNAGNKMVLDYLGMKHKEFV